MTSVSDTKPDDRCTARSDRLVPCVGSVTDGVCAMHQIARGPVREMLLSGPLPWQRPAPNLHDVAWLRCLSHWCDAVGRQTVPDAPTSNWSSAQRAAYRQGVLLPDREAMLERTPGWAWSGPNLKRPTLEEAAAEPRMAKILAMFDDDATLEEIGQTVGVTRERVRQLVKPHRPTRTEKPRLRPADPPIAPEDVAAAIRSSLAGVKPSSHTPMRRFLERFAPTPLLAPHLTKQGAVPLDEWKAEWTDRLRRAAAAQGEPLSRSRYDLWAVERDEPKSQTAGLRGMLWGDVCEMAGVTTGVLARGPRRDRYWDVERCVAVVEAFAEWALRRNIRPSHSSYPAWSAGRSVPSWALVRLRLGGRRGDLLATCTVRLLDEHFVDVLARLDAGETVDPETYIGPLNTPLSPDGIGTGMGTDLITAEGFEFRCAASTIGLSDTPDADLWDPADEPGCDRWLAKLTVSDKSRPDIPEMLVATATGCRFTNLDGDLLIGDADAEAASRAAARRIGASHMFAHPRGNQFLVSSIVYLDHVEVREDMRRLGLGTIVTARLLRTLGVAVRHFVVITRPGSGEATQHIAANLGLVESGFPNDLYRYAHADDTVFGGKVAALAEPSDETVGACEVVYLRSSGGR